MSRHPLPALLAGEIAGFPSACRLVLAVSGGADSMALLRGMHELETEYKLDLHVAHLDHQLRGPSSERDAERVEHVCRRLAIPCTLGRSDVAALAQSAGCGIEETARDERYRFLEATARGLGFPVIALAHTADDQAETILHHILRGTGLSGLRGIPRERELGSGIRLWRPLLDIERSLVIDYLAHLKQDYCEDESNRNESYTRNRLRHQLLPLLASQYNPHISQSLRRLGRQAAEAEAALKSLADRLLERVLDSPGGGECRLKWQALANVPRHLVREALSQLWQRQGWPRQNMGFDQWEEMAGIALDGGAATFPGKIDVRREGRWLVIRVGDRP